jgi:hypothetical protein
LILFSPFSDGNALIRVQLVLFSHFLQQFDIRQVHVVGGAPVHPFHDMPRDIRTAGMVQADMVMMFFEPVSNCTLLLKIFPAYGMNFSALLVCHLLI